MLWINIVPNITLKQGFLSTLYWGLCDQICAKILHLYFNYYTYFIQIHFLVAIKHPSRKFYFRLSHWLKKRAPVVFHVKFRLKSVRAHGVKYSVCFTIRCQINSRIILSWNIQSITLHRYYAKWFYWLNLRAVVEMGTGVSKYLFYLSVRSSEKSQKKFTLRFIIWKAHELTIAVGVLVFRKGSLFRLGWMTR